MTAAGTSHEPGGKFDCLLYSAKMALGRIFPDRQAVQDVREGVKLNEELHDFRGKVVSEEGDENQGPINQVRHSGQMRLMRRLGCDVTSS